MATDYATANDESETVRLTSNQNENRFRMRIGVGTTAAPVKRRIMTRKPTAKINFFIQTTKKRKQNQKSTSLFEQPNTQTESKSKERSEKAMKDKNFPPSFERKRKN